MALNAVTEKQAIINLMQKTTVEVTPGGRLKWQISGNCCVRAALYM